MPTGAFLNGEPIQVRPDDPGKNQFLACVRAAPRLCKPLSVQDSDAGSGHV
jgi:hypothetical protein